MQVRLPLRRASLLRLRLRGRPDQALVVRGRAARLTGWLETEAGDPIAGAPVFVSQQRRTGGGWRSLPTLSSDAHGRFSFRAGEGASRTVRFAYQGTPRVKPATALLRMLVPARSAIRVDRRSVRNGEAVNFSGHLIGGPVPQGGKLIDLQAYYRGSWRTFATPRTDAHGRWRYRYRFGATSGVVRYRFRARIRREAAYPYELGYSRRVRVTVRG
jgi:hypothetical protein